MRLISRLEQDSRLDAAVSAGQRVARLIRPGMVRGALHGVWLGHPVQPMLVQATTGAWLSASILDLTGADEKAARRLVAAGIGAAVPAAHAGAADWSEQHEQQTRLGVIHAAGNVTAVGLYAASLAQRGPRAARLLRLAGLAAVSASGLLGGHISFRLAGGANHAEQVPDLDGTGLAAPHARVRPARGQAGPPAARRGPGGGVRDGDAVYVLADRCSHMSGPLSDGKLADGCLTCPWHDSVFRIADGSVARGPATAPQPAFETREAGDAIQICLPGAG
jgi:nitrite reductase/ring-hydroxylating ferredoxin subunit